MTVSDNLAVWHRPDVVLDHRFAESPLIDLWLKLWKRRFLAAVTQNNPKVTTGS
jgi:hypothetical protein